MSNDNKLQIFTLTERTDKNGNTYMTGKMGFLNVIVFKNKNKVTSDQHDWSVYLQPAKKKKEEGFSNNPNFLNGNY